jgi:hypothetical protein
MNSWEQHPVRQSLTALGGGKPQSAGYSLAALRAVR